MLSLGTFPERIKLNPDHPHEVVDEFRYNLGKCVIGQPDGVTAMSNSVTNGIFTDTFSEPDKPIATMLFLGPTGTGKTIIAKRTAELLHGDAKMVRVDCHGFQAGHEISTLIGSPPGYVDREVKPRLHQNYIDQQKSKKSDIVILLFDEIEKASHRLFNLLLGAMDEGVITLNDNSVTSFKKCILVFTSNVGAKEMRSIVSSGIGFSGLGSRSSQKTSAQIHDTAIRAAEKRFPPEFFNRFNEVVVFNTLHEQHYREILDIELRRLQERISSSDSPFLVTFTDSAKDLLLSKGVVPKYGARPLRNQIHKLVTAPLRRIFHTRQIPDGHEVIVDRSRHEDRLEFYSQISEIELALSTLQVQTLIAGEDIPPHAKVGKDVSGKVFKLKPGMKFLGNARQYIPKGGTVILKD